MLLVDRYLELVRKQLPRSLRDDVAAELRETLLSQIEAKQAEDGRPMTDDDVAEMLKRYGAPDAVAARYGAPQHLIGPAVYPLYARVLKVVLLICGALLLIGAITSALTSDRPAITILGVLWTGALITVANVTVITLLFARLDRMHVDMTEAWDPRALLGQEPPQSVRRWGAFAALVMTTFWLLWWIDVLPINRWLIWSRLPLRAAPIWDSLTPLIVTLMIVSIIVNAVAIARPRWIRLYEAVDVVLDLGTGVMLYLALRAREFVVVTDPAAPGAAIAGILNTVIFAGLLAWGAILIISIGATVRRWRAIAKRNHLNKGSTQNTLNPQNFCC
jgi:HAAS domain-containing protein